ncbi:hypothetical protein U1Q18_039730 [Sarracenia purpurea var. burkii]
MGDTEEAARLTKEIRDSRGVIYSWDSENVPEFEQIADSPSTVCEISVLDPNPTFSVRNPEDATTITHQSTISSYAKSPRSVKALDSEAMYGKPLLISKSSSLCLVQSTEKLPEILREEKTFYGKGAKASDNDCEGMVIEGSDFPFNSNGNPLSQGNGEEFPLTRLEGIHQPNCEEYTVKASSPTKEKELGSLPPFSFEPAPSNPSLIRRKKWARHVRPFTHTDPKSSTSTKRKLTEVGISVPTDNPKKLKAQEVNLEGANEAQPNDESSFSKTAEAAVQPCRSL